MKDLQYLFTILYLQNSLCTIDVHIPEYQYLSRQLTPEECRRLYASLHFLTFNLPAALAAAEKNVPKVPCFKLLTKWDKGKTKREGKDKSHVDVARRLRQIGREDLADWLNKVVVEKLVKEINVALDTNFSNKTEKITEKLYIDKRKIGCDWTMYDSVLWVVLAGLTVSIALVFVRIVIQYCIRRGTRKKAREEEIMELLHYGSVESDQETIYEGFVKNNQLCENDRDYD